jgi:tetratricopeptide (TPR) repeat protein
VASAVGVLAWWWWHDPLLDPPLPVEIVDPEVREVFEQGRARLMPQRRSGAAWGEYGTLLLANLFDREAGRCFEEATKRDAEDPRWPYALGQIALRRTPETAVTLLRRAASLARDNPEYRQAFALTLAEALLERGEAADAATILQSEVRPPDPQRAHFDLGLVALSRNDDAEAFQQFKLAENHQACRRQAKVQLAGLARARGDTTAAKQYEAEANALGRDPPWPDPYLDKVVHYQVGYRGMERRVTVLERDGKFAQAAELFLDMINIKPTSRTLTGLGVNLARLGRYDEALPRLREAVQLDPDDPNAHYTLALVLFTKWEKVALDQPGSEEAAAGFREVIKHARRTTEIKADHANAYLFWGLALKFLGEPRAAIAPLQTGLTVEPEQFDLHLGLGQVLAASGDREGAEASLKAAAQLRPKDPRPAQEMAKLKNPR